jgi:hypothetical protein
VNNYLSFCRSFVKLVKNVVGWISRRKKMMGNLRRKSVLEFLLHNGFLFTTLSHQWNRGTMFWFIISLSFPSKNLHCFFMLIYPSLIWGNEKSCNSGYLNKEFWFCNSEVAS